MATEAQLHVVREPLEAHKSAGHPTFQEATRDFQRDLLERTLQDLGWNVSATARRLKLARSHVHNLIRQHGLKRH